MLTTEYISSIYIHACLLLNNTCLQFNLLPEAVQTNISYQIPTKTQGGPETGSRTGSNEFSRQTITRLGQMLRTYLTMGNPDMVQKMVQDPTSLVQKKTQPSTQCIIIWKLLSGWFSVLNLPLFAENPIHSLILPFHVGCCFPKKFPLNEKPWEPSWEPWKLGSLTGTPMGSTWNRKPPTPMKRENWRGHPAETHEKTHGFFGGRVRRYPKKRRTISSPSNKIIKYIGLVWLCC